MTITNNHRTEIQLCDVLLTSKLIINRNVCCNGTSFTKKVPPGLPRTHLIECYAFDLT